ncbi:hypothetical protein [Soonwooa sp.]|uniref:hypothetical protein n=1 Tax=Soonwooa sp. TaxID=1938592 RepID=UPI00262A4DE5|nr:hypothetical protein [Soonwooa sp.]
MKNALPAFLKSLSGVALRATQLKKHLSIQGNRSVISIHNRPFSNAIFPASTFSFIQRSLYALLSHFKSKGISVFLTPPKGHASLKKNLHPLGSIFYSKPCVG